MRSVPPPHWLPLASIRWRGLRRWMAPHSLAFWPSSAEPEPTSNVVPALLALAIRQRKTQTFQLHRHVDGLHRDVRRRLELRWGKVENRLHARLDDSIEDALRRFAGDRKDDDIRLLPREVPFDLAD